MQRYENCLILTLPDQSAAVMDYRTPSFYCFSDQESRAHDDIVTAVKLSGPVLPTVPSGNCPLITFVPFPRDASAVRMYVASGQRESATNRLGEHGGKPKGDAAAMQSSP